jgi:hypothetical protein
LESKNLIGTLNLRYGKLLEAAAGRMRILFALPGLHRYDRGAEIAFISLATELAKANHDVTLIGSGAARDGALYRYVRVPSIDRRRFEHCPSLPLLRNECAYEELTFLPGLLGAYKPEDYDVTLTCSFPFTHLALRRPVGSARRPPHVFITQNGDWPAHAANMEYRAFRCEGLVCTNPDYFQRNKARWNSCLIPNGIDLSRFNVGASRRDLFGLQ